MTFKNRTIRNSYITYLVIVVAFIALRILSSFHLLDFLGGGLGYVFNIVVQIGLLFCLSIFMFSLLQKEKIKTTFTFYGYKKISWKAVLIAFIMGVVVFLLNIFVASFFDIILALFGYKFSAGESVTQYPVYMLFVNLFFTALLPAICEETAHRGMLLKTSQVWGQKKAIIISSVLFGLLHCNIEQFFYATIIGVFVGYVSILCDSIYPAMIIHFMNNALSVFMGFSSVNGTWMAKIVNTVAGFAYNGIVGILFLSILFGLLLYFLIFLVKQLFMETTAKKFASLQEQIYKEVAKADYINDINNSKALLNGQDQKENIVDIEKIYMDTNLKMGMMTDLDRKILNGPFKLNSNYLPIILLSFVLTAGVTFLTFILGVIC